MHLPPVTGLPCTSGTESSLPAICGLCIQHLVSFSASSLLSFTFPPPSFPSSSSSCFSPHPSLTLSFSLLLPTPICYPEEDNVSVKYFELLRDRGSINIGCYRCCHGNRLCSIPASVSIVLASLAAGSWRLSKLLWFQEALSQVIVGTCLLWTLLHVRC